MTARDDTLAAADRVRTALYQEWGDEESYGRFLLADLALVRAALAPEIPAATHSGQRYSQEDRGMVCTKCGWLLSGVHAPRDAEAQHLARVESEQPDLPADLAEIQARAEKGRGWLPDEAIDYGPEHDYLALLADAADALVAEVAALRAAPRLTAEEAAALVRWYLPRSEDPDSLVGRAAATLRAIAEQAS